MELLNHWMDKAVIALLTAIAIFVFKKYIRPFVLGVLQNTPDLEGIWQGYDTDNTGDEIRVSRMEIKQLGTHIQASVIRQSPKGERVFKYKGTMSSGQVLLIWKESKSNGYNMGTMTLLLSGDLMSLKGMTTFNHHDKGEIISQNKIYRRIKA